MEKYDYKVSFEHAIKQGIPIEKYARESSKNVIATWIANELAKANELKKIELELQIAAQVKTISADIDPTISSKEAIALNKRLGEI